MGYAGNQPAANFVSVVKDTFSGNASTTAFTLSKAATTNGVAVFVENVRQVPTTAYSVSGTTLTFTAAPVSGTNNVYALHHNAPASTATHPKAQALQATSGTFSAGVNIDGGVVINESSADVDFRVESDNRTHALFVNGADGNIGIGATPESWHSNFTAIDIGDQGAIAHYDDGSSPNTQILQNSYYDASATTWKAKETGASTRIFLGATDLIFYTAPSVSADANQTFTERARITDAGLHLGGTGDTNAIGDYEYGTWTPRLYGTTTGNSTSASQIDANGAYDYYKIGRLVFVNWYFSAQSTSTQMTGTLSLSGLPFTSNGTYMMNGSQTYNMGLPDNINGYYLRGDTAGNTVITFVNTRDNTSWAAIDAADAVPNSTSIYFKGSLTYATDS